MTAPEGNILENEGSDSKKEVNKKESKQLDKKKKKEDKFKKQLADDKKKQQAKQESKKAAPKKPDKKEAKKPDKKEAKKPDKKESKKPDKKEAPTPTPVQTPELPEENLSANENMLGDMIHDEPVEVENYQEPTFVDNFEDPSQIDNYQDSEEFDNFQDQEGYDNYQEPEQFVDNNNQDNFVDNNYQDNYDDNNYQDNYDNNNNQDNYVDNGTNEQFNENIDNPQYAEEPTEPNQNDGDNDESDEHSKVKSLLNDFNKDFYEILNLNDSVFTSMDDVQEAYMGKMESVSKNLRNRLISQEEAKNLQTLYNYIFDILSNKKKRKEYDKDLLSKEGKNLDSKSIFDKDVVKSLISFVQEIRSMKESPISFYLKDGQENIELANVTKEGKHYIEYLFQVKSSLKILEDKMDSWLKKELHINKISIKPNVTKFDENVHDAVQKTSKSENDDFKPNTVSEVLQNGYFTFVTMQDGKLGMSEEINYLSHPLVAVNVLEEGEVFEEKDDKSEKVEEQTLADLETFSIIKNNDFDFGSKTGDTNQKEEEEEEEPEELNIGMLGMGDSNQGNVEVNNQMPSENLQDNMTDMNMGHDDGGFQQEAPVQIEDPLSSIKNVINRIKEEEEE